MFADNDALTGGNNVEYCNTNREYGPGASAVWVVVLVNIIFPAYVSSTRAALVVVFTVNGKYPLFVHTCVPPRNRLCSRRGFGGSVLPTAVSCLKRRAKLLAPTTLPVARNCRFRLLDTRRSAERRLRALFLLLLPTFVPFCIMIIWAILPRLPDVIARAK